MKISLIAAMGENRAIGANGKIPWHLPADFKHFKEVTMGHPIIMGRKTFESIGRPLPGRANIVITRDPAYVRDGVIAAASPDAALAAAGSAAGGEEVFVIGGAEIYKLFLPQADRVYLTKVAGTFKGDAFFPELDEAEWEAILDEEHAADEKNAFPFIFQLYARRKLPEK
jgi:dihydrofolate reductase